MFAEVQAKAICAHLIQIEEDLVRITTRSDYNLSDFEQANVELEAVLAQHGHLFIMIDQTQAGTAPPVVRRRAAEWNKHHQISASVMFGGSVTARAIATLVITAVRIFRPNAGLTPQLKDASLVSYIRAAKLISTVNTEPAPYGRDCYLRRGPSGWILPKISQAWLSRRISCGK